MSNTSTEGIRVIVVPQYLPEQSNKEEGQYFFAYHVQILNESNESVKLINRHWIIHESNGTKEEVKGPGVVGKTPLLKPGESFEYSSFCPLKTPYGSMQGSYEMQKSNGETFNAQIGLFNLISDEVTFH